MDCAAGPEGNGSVERPWNSLAGPDSTVFVAGDVLALRRGTTCDGMLDPRGSGEPRAPIRLVAYGSGSRPVIDGGGHRAALWLDNQQYWDVSGISTSGGRRFGILVSGDSRVPTTLHHIHLVDVVAEDVEGTATTKASGAIVVEAGGSQVFHDVVIDRAVAGFTRQWAGIEVRAGSFRGARGSDVTVERSLVEDVGGDGILVADVSGARTEGNVALGTGEIMTAAVARRIGTPSAIWDFACDHCVVEDNVAYGSQTAVRDGGDFDIDYGSKDEVVRDNLGFDSAGYCVSVFSAAGRVEDDVRFSHNICLDNATSPSVAPQGDVFFSSFAIGHRGRASIDGASIEDDYFGWSPSRPSAVLVTTSGVLSGSLADVFRHDVVVATVPDFVDIPGPPLRLGDNVYVDASPTSKPRWTVGGHAYTDFPAYQAASGEDRGSRFLMERSSPGCVAVVGQGFLVHLPISLARLIPGQLGPLGPVGPGSWSVRVVPTSRSGGCSLPQPPEAP